MATTPAEHEASLIPRGLENNKKPISNYIFHYDGYRDGSNTRIKAVVQAFIGSTRKYYLTELRERAVQFDQAIFIIPEDQALQEVFQNMKHSSGSMLLVRERDPKLPEESFAERMRALSYRAVSLVADRFGWRQALEESQPNSYLRLGDIGYTTQQLLTFQTEKGVNKKVLYMSTLAFLSDYRRMGFAAKCLQIANLLYRPDYIALRLRGGAAYAAVLKSRLLDKTSISPFSFSNGEWKINRWDETPERVALLKVLGENTVHPNPIDPVTGISEAVYAEGRDRAYIPDPTHKIAYGVDLQMRDMGLRSERGDAMYVAGRVVGRSREDSMAEFIEV